MCDGAIVMDIAMSNGNGSSLKGAGVGTRAASLTIFSIMNSPCALLNCTPSVHDKVSIFGLPQTKSTEMKTVVRQPTHDFT